jgi:hypothetical protein
MNVRIDKIDHSHTESKPISRVEQKIRDRAAFNAVDPVEAQEYLNGIFQPKNWRIKNIHDSVIGFKL